VISAITYGELLYGVHKSGRQEEALPRLQELTQLILVAPLPMEAAETYGRVRAYLSAKGEIIGNNDLWIAAHAMAAGLTLVTANEAEFRRIPKLKLVNWARGG
jgi:tRNA(fMet)-specific endonuclease VapC